MLRRCDGLEKKTVLCRVHIICKVLELSPIGAADSHRVAVFLYLNNSNIVVCSIIFNAAKLNIVSLFTNFFMLKFVKNLTFFATFKNMLFFRELIANCIFKLTCTLLCLPYSLLIVNAQSANSFMCFRCRLLLSASPKNNSKNVYF